MRAENLKLSRFPQGFQPEDRGDGLAVVDLPVQGHPFGLGKGDREHGDELVRVQVLGGAVQALGGIDVYKRQGYNKDTERN